MKIAALQGDTVFCPDCPQCPYPPNGPYFPTGFISSSVTSSVFINGRPVALAGDIAYCGGPTVLVEGSQKLFIEGRPLHRVGDLNSCLGVTIGPGAENFFSE